MKFTARQSDLGRILQNSFEFISSGKTVSIYSNIYLELEKNELFIKSTSVVSGFSGKIEVHGEEDGVITVQASILCDVIKNLKGEEILSFFTDSQFLYISTMTNSINYKIRFVAADSFDYSDFQDFEANFEISAELFRDIAEKSVSCVSNDASRINLCGVCAKFKKDSVTFLSSDSKCCLVYEKKIDVEGVLEEKNIIIPSKFFRDFLKMDIASDIIRVSFNDSVFNVDFDSSSIWTVLIKSSYPSTDALFKYKYENSVVLSCEDVLSALRHIAIVMDDEGKRIKLHFNESKLLLSSIDKEEIGFGKEDLDIDYAGDEVELAVCYTYLQDQLKMMKSVNFRLSFSTAGDPIRLDLEPEGDYSIVILTTSV